MSNFLTDLFNGRKRSRVRRFRLSWGSANINLTNERYADVIISSMFDQLLTGLHNTELTLVSGSSVPFGRIAYLFKHDIDKIVMCLYADGIVYIDKDEEGFYAVGERKSAKTVYTFTSSDYEVYGVSTKTMLKPLSDYLDNVINAANTSIKRLGVMAFLMPKSDSYGNGLTEDELDEEEKKLQTAYGILDDQKVIKITSRDYSLGTLNIGGANLQLDSRMQSAIKMICGKIKVPYELIPCAIVGNPNQTGVYQREALKRLYQTIAEYCNMFIDFVDSQGIKVEYNCTDAPQDFETDSEELTSKILANIQSAEASGYLSHDEAIELFRQKILNYEK